MRLETFVKRAVVGLAVLLLVSHAGAATAQTKKPNILVIWGDDIGWYNVSAFQRLQGVPGRDAIVIFAAAARTQDETRFVAGAVSMLARYHEAVTPIVQVSAPGPILGTTASGALVVPMPVDYIAWTERVAGFPKRSDIQAAPEHVGFVSGRLSPLASKEFTKRDWKMFESYTIAAER